MIYRRLLIFLLEPLVLTAQHLSALLFVGNACVNFSFGCCSTLATSNSILFLFVIALGNRRFIIVVESSGPRPFFFIKLLTTFISGSIRGIGDRRSPPRLRESPLRKALNPQIWREIIRTAARISRHRVIGYHSLSQISQHLSL